MNFKNIHIGTLIKQKVEEEELDNIRICSFFKCSDDEIIEMYNQEDITTHLLLKWSKLLKYDFFRIYTQHLILFSPPSAIENNNTKKESDLPIFRKNIYTKEIIEFILEQIITKEMTKKQVIEYYNIPKTTLYKWLNKYQIKVSETL